MTHNKDYLIHHGIKGQKWGIRRFQRPDGTRTTAGKKRRNSEIDKEVTTSKQKKRMSNEELQKRIERLRMEKELKSLERETMNSGKAFAVDVLKGSSKKALTQIGAGAIVGAVSIGLAVALAKSQGQSGKGAAKDALDKLKGMIPNAKNQW